MIFDYGRPAKLFMPKRKGGARRPLGYRRFTTAAEAICFMVEKFPAMPVMIVANDQTVMPTPITGFAPKRSTSRPIGITHSV